MPWAFSRDPPHVTPRHYDNREPKPGSLVLPRSATFMIYLSDVEEGGATAFPKAEPALSPLPEGVSYVRPRASSSSGSARGGGDNAATSKFGGGGAAAAALQEPLGLKVFPRRGRALLFFSQKPNGQEVRSRALSLERTSI